MSHPLHIIRAQICELGITLASETVDAKSNEIPAVQGLLKKMDIEGCLIVADALNCQQKTAEIIVEGKGDYLLDAKGNQPSLEAEISEYVRDDLLRNGMARPVINTYELKTGRVQMADLIRDAANEMSQKEIEHIQMVLHTAAANCLRPSTARAVAS